MVDKHLDFNRYSRQFLPSRPRRRPCRRPGRRGPAVIVGRSTWQSTGQEPFLRRPDPGSCGEGAPKRSKLRDSRRGCLFSSLTFHLLSISLASPSNDTAPWAAIKMAVLVNDVAHKMMVPCRRLCQIHVWATSSWEVKDLS
jgi:hypothetical protein